MMAFQPALSGAGFSEVLTEIKNENFLRRVDSPGTTDLLAEEVTLANTIRYIINCAGQRIISTKDSIEILDLEPGNAQSGALTKETVLGWLGEDSIYGAGDISITTMSTAEFIGKIEDINEVYDLVYIGTCIDGFNTRISGGETITYYNDTSMDGLIYANIGDTYYSSSDMIGLLARDTDSSDKTLFRFSGNDITPTKVQELLYFAQAGYPVVIANDIFMPSESGETTPFSINVTASVNGEDVTLTAGAIDSESGTAMKATFRWYRAGSGTVLETDTNTFSSNYTFEALSGENQYYCVATASTNPEANATSNYVLVTKTSGLTVTVDTDSYSESGSYGGSVYFDAVLTYSEDSDLSYNELVTITATARGLQR